MHPEAAAWVERAHYLPFLSLPILRSNVGFLIGHPRRYLGTLAAMLRGTWRQRELLRSAGSASSRRVVHAATEMRRARRRARPLPLRDASGPGRLPHPSPGRHPVQLHGARLRSPRRSDDALPEGRRSGLLGDHLALEPGRLRTGVRRPDATASRSSTAGSTARSSSPTPAAVDGDPRGHLRRDAPRGQGPALPHRRRGGARRAGRRRGRDVHRRRAGPGRPGAPRRVLGLVVARQFPASAGGPRCSSGWPRRTSSWPRACPPPTASARACRSSSSRRWRPACRPWPVTSPGSRSSSRPT